jgi:hypothetical protein
MNESTTESIDGDPWLIPGKAEYRCEIVPVDRHDGDGVTTEWDVRDPWAGRLNEHAFETPEAAADWAIGNGHAPDLRLVAAYRMGQALAALGPYGAAEVIVDGFSIHELVRFELEFRRRLDARVTAEDHFMDSVSGTELGLRDQA